MIADPLLKRLVRRAYQNGHGLLHQKSTTEVHQHIQKLVPPPKTDYPFESYAIAADINFRIFRNMQPSTGTLCFIRASAFTGGGLMDDTNPMCHMLSQRFNKDVVNIDFRMPPDYQFPFYFEDALTCVRYLEKNAEALKLKRPMIAWGESSGGTMVASINQALAQQGHVLFDAQVLLYPMLDLVTQYPSKQSYGYGYMLDNTMIQWLCDRVLVSPSEAHDFRASPGLHPCANQPATIMLTCEYDPLRDEALAYAKALQALGCLVEQHMVPGMVHGFIRYFDKLKSAGLALDWIEQCLAKHTA